MDVSIDSKVRLCVSKSRLGDSESRLLLSVGSGVKTGAIVMGRGSMMVGTPCEELTTAVPRSGKKKMEDGRGSSIDSVMMGIIGSDCDDDAASNIADSDAVDIDTTTLVSTS